MNRFPQYEVTRGINIHTAGGVTHERLPLSDPNDHTLPKLIEALGGLKAFEALPVLDLKACTAWGGSTGYIDFVRPDDMDSPIMRGEDEAGRPFVAFRISSGRRPGAYVEVLFRRYTEGPVWVSGGGSELSSHTLDRASLSRVAQLVAEGAATGGRYRVDLVR